MRAGEQCRASHVAYCEWSPEHCLRHLRIRGRCYRVLPSTGDGRRLNPKPTLSPTMLPPTRNLIPPHVSRALSQNTVERNTYFQRDFAKRAMREHVAAVEKQQDTPDPPTLSFATGVRVAIVENVFGGETPNALLHVRGRSTCPHRLLYSYVLHQLSV